MTAYDGQGAAKRLSPIHDIQKIFPSSSEPNLAAFKDHFEVAESLRVNFSSSPGNQWARVDNTNPAEPLDRLLKCGHFKLSSGHGQGSILIDSRRVMETDYPWERRNRGYHICRLLRLAWPNGLCRLAEFEFGLAGLGGRGLGLGLACATLSISTVNISFITPLWSTAVIPGLPPKCSNYQQSTFIKERLTLVQPIYTNGNHNPESSWTPKHPRPQFSSSSLVFFG
jgi:hypothetical protein